MREIYRQIGDQVQKADRILVISHRNPDADTLGAALALRICFQKKGKVVTVACVDKPGPRFSFLPGVNKFVKEFDLNDYDLIVVVDAGASYMTDFHIKYPNIFKLGIPVINIDHHASNDNYGDINFVDTNAASVTVMLARMCECFGVEMDKDMATCLLAGIYNDTGAFMHANTNQEAYDVAADLMSKGANVAAINKFLFKSNSLSTLKLWGRAMEKANLTDGDVVMSVVTDEDYNDVHADPEQLSGVIDYLNMVPGSRFAVLINEDRRGNIKGSLRSRTDDVDVSKIAAQFGGGGHPKASGFSVSGRLKKDYRYRIVSDEDAEKALDF